MRVAIDARVEYGRAGGVQQGIAAVASALAALDPRPDLDLSFLTLADRDAWLRPYLPVDAHVVPVGADATRALARRLRGVPAGRRLLVAAGDIRSRRAVPSGSSGRFERLDADVALFPTQVAELTSVPFVYQPWDLQHRHLPALFRPAERHRRDVEYQAYCDAAAVVVVATEWVARDLAATFRLDPDKIVVIAPWAPSAVRPAAAHAVDARRPYALYPAQAWPHKNHDTLFEAIAQLRAEGLAVSLRCPGATGDRVDVLRRTARSLGIDDLIQFPGYVDDDTMAALWGGARCLVFPSRFEGWGYPVLEAMDAGVPVACANGHYLDAAAGNAALRFDAGDAASIASALRILWTDEVARARSVALGRARVAACSWRSIGEQYLAVFERARAGRHEVVT